MTRIVLGSQSPYRKQLLQKLLPEFSTAKPNIDETPHIGESPDALVKRLAFEKGLAVAANYPDHLIISSDQIALHNNEILGKPHTEAKAIAQLSRFSGDKVTFLTSLCVMDAKTPETHQLTVEIYNVHFRKLSLSDIQAYVAIEKPLDCAGSFKSEGLGITLFERFEGNDPNALIGLPLIQLTKMLTNAGVNIYAQWDKRPQ